ncbi:MAG TPA: hypothetical protein VME47_24710 [Acetobacteraceae bacterium]|nr:hypothetical protein [Acetobacteraceae bacterium]
MISNALSVPAYAYAPDADRAGSDASARLSNRLIRFLVLVAFLVREYWLAIRDYRAGTLPSWWYCRSDLPPGSVQQLAASIRGEFGNAIAWMCRRRGIGPGHKDWPELSRAIVAFGGSIKGFRPGLPACGLQWWENSLHPARRDRRDRGAAGNHGHGIAAVAAGCCRRAAAGTEACTCGSSACPVACAPAV